MKNTTTNFELIVGSVLTINGEIISNSGKILYKSGDKVVVSEVIKGGGYWGKVSGCWIDKRIDGVKLKNHHGIWNLSCFKETQVINK